MSTTHRVDVVWSSHGAQLQRDLQQFLGLFNQVNQKTTQGARGMSLWGQQMKAIGTTVRYAFAGSVVFAVTRAISSLADFESRLGEIDSLAAKMGSGGHLESLGDKTLGKIGDMALDASNKIGVSVDQIQQHMIAFYSAFNAPAGQKGIQQMQEFVNAMTDLTLVSEGADPSQLARAVAAMSRDIQTGQLLPGKAGDVSDIIASILQTTPNIRGEDIARDVGRLSAARVAAGMTPEQIFGVYGQAAKAGGSPAVIGRGVTQLLTTGIVRPRTAEEKAAFQKAVGTADPTALRNLGGIEILRRMMRAVDPTGRGLAQGQRRLLGSEDLTDEQALGSIGRPRGINLTLATQLFGRQESLRVFLNLLSQNGPAALDKYIESLKNAEKYNVASQRAKLANDRRFLQQLQTTQQNLGISMLRAWEPVLRPLTRGVARAEQAATHHPVVAQAVMGAAAAGWITSRFGITSRILSRTRFGRIAGGVAGPALAAEIGAGPAAFTATGLPTGLAGQAGAGSRGNPFWVVIDPMSWFLPGAPQAGAAAGVGPTPSGGGGRGGLFRRLRDVAATGLGAAARGLRFAGGWRAIAGGIAGGAEAINPAIIPALIDEAMHGGSATQRTRYRLTPELKKRYPFIYQTIQSRMHSNRPFGQNIERQLYRYEEGDITARTFERYLRSQTLRHAKAGGLAIGIEGEAALRIDVGVTPEAKRLLAVTSPQGIPVKLWNQGHPQHRGKNKAQRGQPTR